MKRYLSATLAMLGVLAFPLLAWAPPGVVDPTNLVLSETHTQFKLVAAIYDYKASFAVISYESWNGTAYTGYPIRVTLAATGCTIVKGTAVATACTTAGYTASDFVAAVDDNAKGMLLGADDAFTAGYGP